MLFANTPSDEKTAKAEFERGAHDVAQTERRVMAEFVKLQEAAQALVPDMAEVLEDASDLIATPAMQHAIYRSEIGPHLMLHLAKNPDDFHRIAAMSPADTLKAMGRLEAKVEAQVEALKKPTPAPKAKEKESPKARTASSAPQPETPLRGQSPASKSLAELAGPDDRHVDMVKYDREYERKRSEQRRQG